MHQKHLVPSAYRQYPAPYCQEAGQWTLNLCRVGVVIETSPTFDAQAAFVDILFKEVCRIQRRVESVRK